MFDLLHVLSTAEKGLVSTDFQFIGIKDEGQRAIRNGSFIMDYMEKCENYIFKLYLFSTAAGRIKSSLTEDSKYTYRNARTGAKSWTQEFFYPRVTS